MPAERTAMRQVRDVLRLRTAGVAINEIARRVGVAPSTVRLTLKRLVAAGLRWPLPAEMTDATLEARLFTAVGKKQGHRRRGEPDWAAVHRELKRKHVTLSILWDEYIARHPDGYRYSRFCELYQGWASRISVTMRQTHAGGDKLFVDYAGATVPVIIDRLTGETRPAQIFVAVMGASNFTYAEASWTQALADWIGAHTRAFAAIGGVPNLLVPDNTKVAVIKACLYEPQVNRTYAEMAAHYDTAILPARPRRPRDKAPTAPCAQSSTTNLIAKPRTGGPPTPSQSSTPISADPATTIDPLMRMDIAHPSDSRSADPARSFPAWRRPLPNSKPPVKARRSRMPIGSACSSSASSPIAATSALPPACATPGCATTPPSRTSTTVRRADSIARCSRSSPPASGSTRTTISSCAGRPASAKVGSRAPSATRPAATTARFSISASRRCLPISRWRAATVAMPASCAASTALSSSSSTIGGSNRSTATPAAISTKSSKSVTAAAPPSSPVKSRSTNGTR